MLFMTAMEVQLPNDMGIEAADDLRARERARAHELQRAGKLRHIWRVAGRYANVSIWDVDSVDELHDALCSFPMFPYLDIEVTALAKHPSALPAGS
ncbi:MAG: muconolactone Delta-isomerase [bacterium]|jgi:muconolactone D-isomerase|nr:muconolactone Delta-isomerase [bacterium]